MQEGVGLAKDSVSRRRQLTVYTAAWGCRARWIEHSRAIHLHSIASLRRLIWILTAC